MSMAADEDPAVVVPKIVAFLTESLAERPELYRLLQVAVVELPGAGRVIREHLGPIFDTVSAYFQRCAQRGVIHPVPASLPTLGILGTVIAHSNLNPLISACQSSFASPAEEAGACSELWLRALASNSQASGCVRESTSPGVIAK